MLKIFRGIRGSTIMDNKAQKYLLYAVGEIVLVVIGILLALQINSWNQDRLNKKIERDYVVRIVNDLKQDTTMMGFQINNSKAQITNGIYIDSIIHQQNPPLESSGEFIFKTQLLGRTFTPNYHTSAYDDLVNTGNFALFKNRSAVDSIQFYYSNLPLEWNDIFDRRNEELRNVITDILPLKYHTIVLNSQFNIADYTKDAKILSMEEQNRVISEMFNYPKFDYYIKLVTRAHLFNLRLMQGVKENTTITIQFLKSQYNLE